MKKTKIVSTIGPASAKEDVLKKLILNGMDVTRLNFSHGTLESHHETIELIKKVREKEKHSLAIMLDTKGPEIRICKMKDDGVLFKEGQHVTITTEDIVGDEYYIPITYTNLSQDVMVGDVILIDDGLLSLRILEIPNDRELKCLVLESGLVKSNKGVNVPNVKISLPALTRKDKVDLKFGIEEGIDIIAASFIRKAEDVLEIRHFLEENGGGDIFLIAKIENREGLDNIDEIIKVADGIMVARGDLGVEIPTENVPLAQKSIIRKSNYAGKPVITATQMLDSMIRNPRPTRAEVTDVANAILDGTDAIMLSGETAIGKYPVEAVKTMNDIAEKTESSSDFLMSIRLKQQMTMQVTVTNSISRATKELVESLNGKAIISITNTGYTARSISKFRPLVPIIAATLKEKNMRKLSIVWGVYSFMVDAKKKTEDLIEQTIAQAVECNMLQNGDVTVVAAGVPLGVAGSTNYLRVYRVGKILLKGTGIGKKKAYGRVKIVKNPEEALLSFKDGDVLVTCETNRSYIPLMEKASAIITSKDGYTSHAAIVGVNLEKPVIVGVEKLFDSLKDEEMITIDANDGLIYKGKI